MIVGVYAIRDAQTGAFSQPMYFVTQGVAMRSFIEECENTTSALNKHPDDFALFKLAHYDDNLGVFENLVQPEKIALASDYKKVQSV